MTTYDAKPDALPDSEPADPACAGAAGAGAEAAAPTDQQLMRQIAEGDEAAMEVLFDRYRQAVFAICLRVLRNESDAEEALLDIFWEVWRQPQRFDGRRGTVSTYLMMLTRSRAIDHHRARAARGRAGNAATPLDVDDQSQVEAGPAEMFWLTEQREQVREALQSLSPAQREAVELSFYEGLSHQQVAERLNKPLGTIKTRIRLGLIRLRDALRIGPEEGNDALP